MWYKTADSGHTVRSWRCLYTIDLAIVCAEKQAFHRRYIASRVRAQREPGDEPCLQTICRLFVEMD